MATRRDPPKGIDRTVIPAAVSPQTPVDFAQLTGKPTTLGGYGITDAAPLASPALTGNPTAPTPAPGDNDTSVATTGFVTAAIAAIPPGASSLPPGGILGDVLTKQSATNGDATWVAPGAGGTPKAAAALTGTVKTDVTQADPVVYTKATVDSTFAPLASPALTGNPTAPTPTAGDNDTSVATTAFVAAAIAAAGSGATVYPMVYSRSGAAYAALPASAIWATATGVTWTVEWLYFVHNFSGFGGPMALGTSGDSFILYFNAGVLTGFPFSVAASNLQLQREARVRRISVTRNAGVIKTYLDGYLVDSAGTISNAGAIAMSGTQRRLFGDGGSEGMNLQAQADLRIWSTERTAAEIKANAFTRLVGTETGLLNYWKMDEGTGTTLNDSGPSAAHATMNGALEWITATR